MTTTMRAPSGTPALGDTDVISTATLHAAGVSSGTVGYRCRPGGPWQRLLPGVILLSENAPSRRQLVAAAMVYAGPGAVLTGLDALQAYGLRLPPTRDVHVLAPADRRLANARPVLVERTTRIPDPIARDGLPCAPPARAVLDAARRLTDAETIHHLLSRAVHDALCTPGELRTELASGSQRGSARVRGLLRGFTARQDTYLHTIAKRLMHAAPLPRPRWHVTLCDRTGRPIGMVDAWWDEIGFGWDFDPVRPDATRLALEAQGIPVLRTRASRLGADNESIIREVAAAFHRAIHEPRQPVLAYGCAE